MPVRYDDPRFLYESGDLSYDGTLLVPTLTGAQSSGSGQLTAVASHRRALTGVQVSGTGTLAARVIIKRILAGAQPSGLGALTPHTTYHQTLLGEHGAQDTGQLAYAAYYKRSLVGVHPAGTGQLTRRVSYRRTLLGIQPAGTASVTTHRRYRQTLTGFQPAYTQITYDEPGVLYDDFSYTYEVVDAGHLQWRVFFHQILVGLQPETTGELGWLWNPYIWAQYTSSIYPDRVEYIATFETEITDVRYDADEQALRESAPETVYVFKGPQLYSRAKVKP